VRNAETIAKCKRVSQVKSEREVIMLSILIPTFNDDCTTLVENMVHQASSLNAIDWEIIVGDDVSTNQAVVDANRSINALPIAAMSSKR
jgi:hypothetical protein